MRGCEDTVTGRLTLPVSRKHPRCVLCVLCARSGVRRCALEQPEYPSNQQPWRHYSGTRRRPDGHRAGTASAPEHACRAASGFLSTTTTEISSEISPRNAEDSRESPENVGRRLLTSSTSQQPSATRRCYPPIRQTSASTTTAYRYPSLVLIFGDPHIHK
jgi:hypothetical protein